MLTRPRQDLPSHPPDESERPSADRRGFHLSRGAVATALLFVVFFGLYHGFAARIVDMPVAKWRTSFMFHADPARVTRGLTGPRHIPDHERTNVHPLFSILYNPLGSALTAALGSATASIPLLIAASGALSVALARSFFSHAGFALADAVILAAILGVTASHAFFGAVAETYAFTAASLIAVFCTLVWKTRNLAMLAAIHVVAFGNLITNIVQTGIVSAFSHGPTMLRKAALVRTITFCAAVLLGSALLSLLQLVLYPTSRLFFMPASLLYETRYLANADAPAAFVERAQSLVLHMFSYSFVAPTICVIKASPPTRSLPTVTFDAAQCSSLEAVSPLGSLATLIWFGLLVVATGSLVQLIRDRSWRGPEALIVACLGTSIVAHFGLHLAYGDNFFLYSPTWTFEILAAVALLVKRVAYQSAHRRLTFRALLLVLLALLAGHSAMFLESIIGVYARARL